MTYSHPATRQDEWVLSRLPSPNTFLEVGAYDGLKHSNTLLLEEHGWVGALIEGCPEYARQCALNRPDCAVIDAAVGTPGSDGFYVGGQWSGLRTQLSSEVFQGHLARGNKYFNTKVVPLSKVFTPQHVGYLSIDIEGGEEAVLGDWFQSGGTADAVSVEFNYDQSKFTRLRMMMDSFGYVLDELRGFDMCFLRELE